MEIVDPASLGGKRGPGRPKGSRNKPKELTPAPAPKAVTPAVPVEAKWEKNGYRVLIAPYNYGTFYRRWDTAMSADGAAVKVPVDVPVSIKSIGGYKDRVGTWELKAEQALPDRDGDFVGTETPPRMLPLYGAQLRIDSNLATECGVSFKELVSWFTNRRAYGRRYAWADDDVGINRLIPKFRSFVVQKQMDRSDSDIAPTMAGGIKVGRAMTDEDITNQ